MAIPSSVGYSPPKMAIELSSRATAQNLMEISNSSVPNYYLVLSKLNMYLDLPSGMLGPEIHSESLNFSEVLDNSPLIRPPSIYI